MAHEETPEQVTAIMAHSAELAKEVRRLQREIAELLAKRGNDWRAQIDARLDRIAEIDRRFQGSFVHRVMTTLTFWERLRYRAMKEPANMVILAMGLGVYIALLIRWWPF